jgi:hypothetical protein
MDASDFSVGPSSSSDEHSDHGDALGDSGSSSSEEVDGPDLFEGGYQHLPHNREGVRVTNDTIDKELGIIIKKEIRQVCSNVLSVLRLPPGKTPTVTDISSALFDESVTRLMREAANRDIVTRVSLPSSIV